VLISRRDFVLGAAAGFVMTPRIRALAFDAFPIFDPMPIFALADAMYPGTGLSDEWRTRQFEYTWLRVAARHYADFWQVTEDALVFAANRLNLRLSARDRATLMGAYLEMRAWPDVVPALESMKKSGLRLVLLSNFTREMLDANIRNAGLHGIFEQVISTDLRRTYKPDPRAYQLGLDVLKLKREELLFVAFAGWDAAGAKVFGYPTFWVNRQKLPAEELGVRVDASGDTLTDLLNVLRNISRL
jgi:2-haloacid dehalogenase